MFILSIRGTAVTASFRVPETHTFQKTLPLPPKTTIIGMMGAAMGLTLESAYDYVLQNKIMVSVYGQHKGTIKDLWNYRKIKNKSYSAEDIKNRMHYDTLIREYLYDNEFFFYFGSPDHEPLKKIREAFASPVYALTVGNSDDLLKICKISEISELNEEGLKQFEHTVVPGDISKSYKHDINFNNIPITETVFTPQVFLLPTKFVFKGDERRVIERKAFTFISTSVVLKTPIMGYVIDGKRVVLQ